MSKGRVFKGKVDELGRECTKCKVYKFWNEYGLDPCAKTKHQGRCKLCTAKYIKEYMKDSAKKEAARLATEKYRDRKDPNRLRWIDIALPTCEEVNGYHYCKTCNSDKKCIEFYKSSEFTNGHESECISCRSARRNERWATNYNSCKNN